ncbi:MAG: hypothetical protein COA69_08370 [Robiginitomaculum sp.]|nr:MAG: hypothetical protein COA69_08370 [Robiginitomaculum sp.]
MTQDDYQELVNTYGVHPSRWPEEVRARAMSFSYKHPERAMRINSDAALLDKIIDVAALPETANSLLMARILKAAQNTPQNLPRHIETPANDHPTRFLPEDRVGPPMSRWKVLAATLLVMMGIGFGASQAAFARSDYWAAETLYSFNIDSDYTSSEWPETISPETQQ